jgi:SM-20-related protein
MNSQFEFIADGLAEQGFAVVDQFLSHDEVQSILNSENFKKGIDTFQKAGIGKKNGHQINESIRGDMIQWIDRNATDQAVKVYLERLTALIGYLNQALYLSLKDYEVHMTIYPAGSFYKRHLDQFKSDDHRRLSVICYLNNDWWDENGGQLRMYHDNRTEDILPVAGRLVCFRSDLLEHEVLPANRERLSLTGWILDQFAELRHL